jgi:hypothetical protein
LTKYKIAAHPIQQAILDLVPGTDIGEFSLREIGSRIDPVETSPQKIKHHLTQMVKYGFLDIIGGRYHIGKLMRKEE